jgi:hypothetical protein
MNSAQLAHLVGSFAEVRLLIRCASRLRVRIGIAGGVVRNLLMSEGTVAASYSSLYDFVDPFGDIDVVLTDETNQSILVRALFAEIPFADCHLWDLQDLDSRKSIASKAGSVAADGLIVWLDGDESGTAKIKVESIDSDVERILEEPLRPAATLRFGTEVRPANLSRLIKFARTQMLVGSSERTLSGLFARFRAQLAEASRPSRREFNRRVQFQIELEMAQLFMTVPDWRDADEFRRQFRETFVGDWVPEASALRQMLTVAPPKNARIGAAVYRSSAQSLLKVDFMTAEGPDEGSASTRIPWTRLELQNRGERGCCPYSDFEDGIAVVAWRNTGNEATRQDQLLPEEDFGLLAYPVAPTQSPDDVLKWNRRIPLLGYVRKGRSIATRLDPAYLKLITGGQYSVFMVGLVSVPALGGVNPPTSESPVSFGPTGDKKNQTEDYREPAYANS